MGAEQERLARPHEDVRLLELRAAGAHGLHFPALQDEARLVTLLDEVIEASLAILGNYAGSLFLGLGH